MAERVKTRLSAAEFFEMPESTQPIELIGGEVIMSPTPVPGHQNIVGNVFIILKRIAQKQGGKAYVSPLEAYLDDGNVVQPDVMWIAPDSRCRVGEKHLHGVPDLVVEVLSPSTAKYDKSTKFRLYETHGAREYWVIEPVGAYIEVWRLEEERFALLGVYGTDDETFASAVLGGQSIEVSEIFGD